MRVQPEIKMADVKPETLKPEFADGIYTSFLRHFRLQAAIFDFSLTATQGSV